MTDILLALVVLLLLGGPCDAHALSPTHYPLGPYPFVMIGEWRESVFLVLIPVVVGYLLLRWRVPGITVAGSLWRSAVLFVASRATEFGLMAAFPLEGWHGEIPDLCGQVAILLVISSLAAIGLLRLLCRITPWRTVIFLGFATTVGGYAGSMAYWWVFPPYWSQF